MTKLINIVNCMLVLLLGTGLCASCFDDEEVDYTVYNDLVLTKVAFGTLPRIMHTTKKSGGDSTYVSSVSATSVYPFTIDQVNNVAYNLDSLPVGTRADKIVLSTFTVNGGSFTLKKLNAEEDTLYAVADTLDFSHGPREFHLYGTDGTSRRTYRVEVRIHQQKADSVSWDQKPREEFDARYSTALLPGLDYEAAGLHFLLNPGQSISVGAAGSDALTEEPVADADKQHLPTDNVCWAQLPSRSVSNMVEVYLYGTCGEGTALAGKFWRHNVDLTGMRQFAWEYFPTTIDNPNPVPALRDVRLFSYDDGLLLVGIAPDKHICIKHSTDRGRTWKVHRALVLPKDMKSLEVDALQSVLDADDNLWLLINDQDVWRGRAHCVSWNEDPRVFNK